MGKCYLRCKYARMEKEKLGFITQKYKLIDGVDKMTNVFFFKTALTLKLEHKARSFSFLIKVSRGRFTSVVQCSLRYCLNFPIVHVLSTSLQEGVCGFFPLAQCQEVCQ